jgi:hypothetical protein
MIDIPIFKKQHLELYQVLDKPGTYQTKVSNTVKPEFLYEDGNKSRYLINLRVATKSNFEECLKILGNREICDFQEVKHCFLTGAIWEKDIHDLTLLPTKGESVIATFDYVDDIIRCVSITLIPRKVLKNFDLGAYNQVKKMYNELLNKL